MKTFQKYLKDNKITGIANQMNVLMALKAEEVLSDRVWYCLHQLVAGNSVGKDLKDPFAPMGNYDARGNAIPKGTPR